MQIVQKCPFDRSGAPRMSCIAAEEFADLKRRAERWDRLKLILSVAVGAFFVGVASWLCNARPGASLSLFSRELVRTVVEKPDPKSYLEDALAKVQIAKPSEDGEITYYILYFMTRRDAAFVRDFCEVSPTENWNEQLYDISGKKCDLSGRYHSQEKFDYLEDMCREYAVLCVTNCVYRRTNGEKKTN